VPHRFSLYQNYPNPFNPTTHIEYSLSNDVDVQLQIFNNRGQLIRTLVEASQTAGRYTVEWNATDEWGIQVSSGLYFYRLTAGGWSEMGKMVLVR